MCLGTFSSVKKLTDSRNGAIDVGAVNVQMRHQTQTVQARDVNPGLF
jgi:hypothetical protein